MGRGVGCGQGGGVRAGGWSGGGGVITNACGFISRLSEMFKCSPCSSELQLNSLWLFQIFHVPEEKTCDAHHRGEQPEVQIERSRQSSCVYIVHECKRNVYIFTALKQDQRRIQPGGLSEARLHARKNPTERRRAPSYCRKQKRASPDRDNTDTEQLALD